MKALPLFALLLVTSGACHATLYTCQSMRVPGLVFQTNAPCDGAVELNRTNRWGKWIHSDKQQREIMAKAEASASEVEAKVRGGMTTQQVEAALGKPSAINNRVDKNGNHFTQWVYRGGEFLHDHYVYFNNGRVSSLSTSR